MKYYAILFIVAALCWVACDNSLNSVGMGMMPDGDKITVDTATIHIEASMTKLDSVYIKSIQGYLGEYYDPLYGNTKLGYMCQFFPRSYGGFPDSVVNNVIDSVRVGVIYKYSIGDSLATMEASVYPVINSLPKHYYSTVNPTEYCDLNTLYGKRTYTARNYNFSSDSVYNQQYVYYLNINLPVSIGEDFLQEARKPVNAFRSKQTFVDFFKGLYIVPTFGKGSLLTVEGTELLIFYRRFTASAVDPEKNVTGIDTVVSIFPVTKEVIQLNTVESANEASLLADNPTTMYIKAPSGICPKLIIPIPELAQKFKGKELSNVQLTLYGYEDDLQKSSLKYPSRLLLIPPDSVKTFFEQQKLIDRMTTYSASWNNYMYDFSNISYLIQKAIKEKPDENLEMLVIPISPMYVTDDYGQATEIGYNNLLTPSAISLKKGKDYLQLRIIAVEKKQR